MSMDWIVILKFGISFLFWLWFETIIWAYEIKNNRKTNKQNQIEQKQKEKNIQTNNRCVLSSAGSSMRRGTPSDCHTDSNTSTTGGNNQIQAQPQTQQSTQPPGQQTQSQQPPQQQPQQQQQQQQPANTQITTHPTYGEDDSSCDSHFLGKFRLLVAARG